MRFLIFSVLSFFLPSFPSFCFSFFLPFYTTFPSIRTNVRQPTHTSACATAAYPHAGSTTNMASTALSAL